MFKNHKKQLYNILLILSRNIFFYKKIGLSDSFETRVYLMFFHNIEYNLRELGFGDVSVNKKMKELNKILYDILLKLDDKKLKNDTFKINHDLVSKYFYILKNAKSNKFIEFNRYFSIFFHFCFELPLDNMI